jgi:hypothetical protein
MLPGGLPLDAFLDALTTGRLRFSGPELRVLLRLAAAPRPLSAAALARDLRLSRRWAREVTAGLVACGVLHREPRGLVITADPGRWRLPGAARTPAARASDAGAASGASTDARPSGGA